jgi:hypothetical protein
MLLKDKRIRLVYRSILIVLCITGLYLNIRGRGFNHSIVYFTIQSNFLVLFMMMYLVCEDFLKVKRHPFINKSKSAIMIAISLTFLVFHVLLRRVLIDSGYGVYVNSIQSYLLHYVIPIFYVGDWLLFDKKGTYKYKDPFYWLIIPYVYILFAMIRAELFGIIPYTDSRFPYFFLDLDLIGVAVIFYITGITLFFIAYSFLIVFIDNKLNK